MATASSIAPSENKAHFLRWMSLLVDGGTLVLRDQFDQRIPPSRLQSELNMSTNRKPITFMIKRGTITKQQEKLLYPMLGQPDSSTFDVSLLACLLQNLPKCGLNMTSPVWKGIPSSMDVSIEADIVRLRLFRNEASHPVCAAMTEQQLLSKWNEIEQVLYRLGSNITDLKKHVDELKSKSIDPKSEQDYEEKLRVWEEMDTALQTEVGEMKTKLHEHEGGIQSLTSRVSTLDTAVSTIEDSLQDECKEHQDIKDTLDRHIETVSALASTCDLDRTTLQHLDKQSKIQEAQIDVVYARVTETGRQQIKSEEYIASNCQQLHTQIEAVEQRVDTTEGATCTLTETVQQLQESVNEVKKRERENISSELKSLASISQMYFEDASTNVYVETKAYEEAKAKLVKNNILIISGHPGEGKTAMSTRLISEVSSSEQCLKLRTPSDWKHVDLKSDIFNCIFIDDIFGAGVLDENLLNKWEKYLPDIAMAVKKKSLTVIITTRHYILEDAKQKIERLTLFKSENVHFLSSKSLSISEREEILKKHMERKNRDIAPGLIDLCVATSVSFFEMLLLQERNFLFGFPECVNMFVNNDELFQRGPLFFQEPNEFFKTCIQDLYKNEEKFLALVMIWSQKKKALPISELDLSSTSHQVQRIAKKFGFKPKAKLIKVLRKSLEHHKDGFLDFDPNNGVYSFNHNVIDDMIGLVLCKDYPKETLEFCSRDFVMEYVTTDSTKDDEFHFYIERHMHENLHAKLVEMLFARSEFPSSGAPTTVTRKTRGHSPKTITVSLELDNGVLFHSAFTDGGYVQTFVQYLIKKDLFEKVLSTPVMTMSGYFLSYGICLEEREVFLPSYSISSGNGALFMELMQQKKRRNKDKIETEENEMSMSLLFAVHKDLYDVVRYLLSNGCGVNEDAIHIASQKENTEILTTLLKNRKSVAAGKGHLVNGNNALIVAAKNGFAKSVQCLVDHGVDINSRNNDKMSALDKAVAYKHEEICRILIEKGASLNVKTGTFKRTPLHVASDIGLTNTAKLLVEHGASVTLKDHRGHYAIHCAALQGHTEVVKVLLQHNISLAKLKITSYGTKSLLKGMTVFHIAVWKNNHDLLDALIELGADSNVGDLYGRTPFYCAVYDGKVDLVMKLMNVCDVSAPEKQGFTPLHAAVHKGHDDIVRSLCPIVNVNARDKFGKTPLHIACEKGDTTIALSLVMDFGADMRMSTRRGDTIYHILLRTFPDELIRQMSADLIEQIMPSNTETGINNIERKPSIALTECISILMQLDQEFANKLERLPNKYGETVKAVIKTVDTAP